MIVAHNLPVWLSDLNTQTNSNIRQHPVTCMHKLNIIISLQPITVTVSCDVDGLNHYHTTWYFVHIVEIAGTWCM